jgi:hypothetical protein
MRTNLMRERPGLAFLYDNTYYTVTRAFTVYALVGHSDSNFHYGSSMVYGNVYRRVELQPGDEVHALVGGTFVLRFDGELLKVCLTITDKSPFEKRYGGELERWPLDALQQTLTPTVIERYPHEFPHVAAGPERCANGIDTVIP